VNQLQNSAEQNIFLYAVQTPAKESLGMHEWKQHKPWFDEECLGFFGSKEEAKNAVGTGSLPK